MGAVVLNNARSIESQIKAAEKELANLDRRKIQLENEIKHLRNLQHSIAEKTSSFNHKTKPSITSESPEDKKINLFRSLFRGREDVFPKRFESKRTGEKRLSACLPERMDPAALSETQNKMW